MGLTHKLHLKLWFLSEVEVSGIPSVAVKCVDIRRNISGEGGLLGFNWRWGSKAWGAKLFGAAANALSIPPGEYVRKNETQRNWRGPAQAVEHVV